MKPNNLLEKVREAVGYIRNSSARLRKFREISDLVGIESKSSLTLDVPTRWNSTYIILSSACLYVTVFEKYEESEAAFRSNLGDDSPNFFDWECVN